MSLRRIVQWLVAVVRRAAWRVGPYVVKVWQAASHRRGTTSPMMTVCVTELPDVLDRYSVYVTGEGEHLWFAALQCPCGCGDTLQVSLHPEGRPRWHLTRHWDGTASLMPSVWRGVGCRSHFFLHRGCVKWCDDLHSPA